MAKRYIITRSSFHKGTEHKSHPMTLSEAVEYYSATLASGKALEHERGNRKVNLKPTTIKALLTSLANSSHNRSLFMRNGGDDYYADEVDTVAAA